MDAPEATSRRLELADVFRAHGDQLLGLSLQQKRAVSSITNCRTAALGGHVQECDACGHTEIRYNSCRNRHCPKCQSLDKVRWIEARKKDLLPVEYHHVVFTAVLHTWTQKLLFHPHIHAIVPGGGLPITGERWVSAKPGFFLPVRVLSIVFRGKLLSALEAAWTSGDLCAPTGNAMGLLLGQASLKNWVVYSKPPVAGADQVIDYLARYTHRIALSNDRLVALKDGQVTLRWKDRANGNQKKLMTLDAVEFLKRFLLHILPRGLVRIRHYGFLANAVRRREIRRCRDLLGLPIPATSKEPERLETWQETLLRFTGRDVTRCPQCKKGTMTDTGELRPAVPLWRMPGSGVAS